MPTAVSSESRSPALTRPAVRVLLMAVIAVAAVYDLAVLAVGVDNLHGNDFGKFYYATRAWLAGGSLYEPTIATRMQVGGVVGRTMELLDMNPPQFHLLVLPFAWLPLAAAAFTWWACNVVAAIAAAMLLARDLRLRLAPGLGLLVLAVTLSSASTNRLFVTNQFTGLLLLAVVVAWRAERRGRMATSGLVLGVLASVKPFLGLFALVWLARRQFRTVAWMTIGGATAFAAGVAVFGVSAHVAWFRALQSENWTWGAWNASLMALAERLFTPTPFYAPAVVAPRLVWPVTAAGTLLVAVPSLFIARRSTAHAWALAIVAALLLSPLGWIYYAALALPGCFELWRWRWPRLAWTAIAALTVPLPVVLGWQPSVWLTATSGSVYVWGMLALWVAIIRSPAPGQYSGAGKPPDVAEAAARGAAW